MFVEVFQFAFGNTLNLVIWPEVDFQIEFHRARNLPWNAESYLRKYRKNMKIEGISWAIDDVNEIRDVIDIPFLVI